MPLYTKIILYSLSNILQKIILKMKNKNRVRSIEEKNNLSESLNCSGEYLII